MESNDYYRPCASLLLAYQEQKRDSTAEIEILLAMRSPQTAFAPKHCVFPGGNLEIEGDAIKDWLTYFRQFGVTETHLQRICLDHLPQRPKPLMDAKDKEIARDISLRIAAIREVFEEVGVLLCLDRQQYKERQHNAENDADDVLLLGQEAVWASRELKAHWQEKVHQDARKFLDLCSELKLIPDLWSLNEWSAWRSPILAQKKYDVAFYITILGAKPRLLLEATEISDAFWLTPSDALKLFKTCEIWLATPQFYEISVLSHLKSRTYLRRIILEKRHGGVQLMQPVYYLCVNGLVVITLPGDDYHSSMHNIDSSPLSVPYSDIEFAHKARNIHRITYKDMYNAFVTNNIDTIFPHPLTSTINKAGSSKL